MEAFVPAGAQLATSRNFLTGGKPLPSRCNTVRRSEGTTEIQAIKLPSFLGFGKKEKGQVETKAAPVPDATTGSPFQKLRAPAFGGRVAADLEKFYNPATKRHQFRAKAAGQNATYFDVRRGPRGVKSENVRDNDQGGFRNMDPYTDDLVRARPGWSSDEAAVGVNVAIRNVFGNANLFESELAELATSISCVKETGDMREFVRALGLSNGYRTRFFERCSNMRFVELNFKHFLGRAPYNQAEVSEQIQILTSQGYNAAINAIIDSDEYDRLFGKYRLPAVNFRGGHVYNDAMNRLGILNGPYLASDAANKKAFLAAGSLTGFSAYGVSKGLPEAWRGENTARSEGGLLMVFPDSFFWNTPPTELKEADLAWRMRYGSWTKYWYKDSNVYSDVMVPQMKHSAEEEAEAAGTLKYGSTMSKKYNYAK